MPAPQPVDLIPADFYVELPHGDEMGQGGHFILRCKYHARFADGIGKSKLLNLREALAQLKSSVAIDARLGDRLF